jgi:hypothetical protein
MARGGAVQADRIGFDVSGSLLRGYQSQMLAIWRSKTVASVSDTERPAALNNTI